MINNESHMSNISICSKIGLINGNDAMGCKRKLIIIGASTGGPRAIETILTKLPSTLNAAILIVQHMPPGFTQGFAQRLDGICDVTVKEAEHGEEIRNGFAYIAQGGSHMHVRQSGALTIGIDHGEPRNSHRPSIDVLCETAGRLEGCSIISVILTGMGNDGTEGIRTLKTSTETICIAESKKTAIIFGMPGAVIAAGLADEIEDIENIAKAVYKYC